MWGREARVLLIAGLLLIVGLLAVACGQAATPTPPPATPTPAAPEEPAATPEPVSTADLVCDADHFGPLVMCQNFSTDYWPVMEQKMQELYEQALAEGGELELWGFSEVDASTQRAFQQRYPGITIESRGLAFGTAAAVIEATQAGARTTDSIGGAYTIFWPVWAAGLIDTEMDWTQYGVPEEYLEPDLPGMFQQHLHSVIMWYNTDLVPDGPPSDPWEFLEPEWENQLVSDIPGFGAGFSFLALRFGEDETKDLARRLLDEHGMIITSDAVTLLLNEERSVFFPTSSDQYAHLVEQGAPLASAAYDGIGVFGGYQGIMKNARNRSAAILHTLWSTFDPDWIEQRFTDVRLTQPTTWGVPGVSERQMIHQPALAALADGRGQWLTIEVREERDRLLNEFRGIATRR